MKWKTGSRTRRRPAGCCTLFCIPFSLICLGGYGVQVRTPELPGQEIGSREVALWSHYETKQQEEGLDRLVEGFDNSRDEYVARWEYQGPSSEFRRFLSIGVAEGKLPDVVLIDSPDMRKYVNLDIFEDITQTAEGQYGLSQFYPEVLSSVQCDDRYYDVPFRCNDVGLVYNRGMFRGAGMESSENWEEFLKVARAVTTGERYGFIMSAIAEKQSSFQLVPWILLIGEEMDDLGGEGTVKTLTLLRNMVEEGIMPKSCTNWSQVDVVRRSTAGKCAMTENGPWALPLVEEAGVDYGVVKLPADQQSIVVTGGENFGVVKGKNMDKVMAPMFYYHKDEVMLSFNKQIHSLSPARYLAEKFRKKSPVYQVFVEQMDHCITRSAYSYWPRITGILSGGLYEVITGRMTPQEVAERIGSKARGREN